MTHRECFEKAYAMTHEEFIKHYKDELNKVKQNHKLITQKSNIFKETYLCSDCGLKIIVDSLYIYYSYAGENKLFIEEQMSCNEYLMKQIVK